MTPAQRVGCRMKVLWEVLKCPQAGFPVGTKPDLEPAAKPVPKPASKPAPIKKSREELRRE